MRVLSLFVSLFILFIFQACDEKDKKSEPRKTQLKQVIQSTPQAHFHVQNTKKHVPIIPKVVPFTRVDPNPISYFWGEHPVSCPTMDPMEFKRDSIVEIAAVMPEFPGGQLALRNYLTSNLIYPEDARELGFEGKVIVSFVVLEDGHMEQVKILRGINGNKSCELEAERLIKNMPHWLPGMDELGRKVKVRVYIPIVFHLY